MKQLAQGIFAMDIHEGVALCQSTPATRLLDVRTPQEYRAGHIPGSESFPLQRLLQGEAPKAERSSPLFVYCLGGMRSRQAAAMLSVLGYEQVTDLGGIDGYTGPIE